MPAWLIWTLAALFSWGAWATFAKLLGDALTAEQSQAISTIGLLPILAALVASGRASLRGASKRGVLLSIAGGVASCLGNIFYYDALARGEKVATVVSLTALYPLTTIFLAMVILRERLSGLQRIGVVLSFVAIWIFNVNINAPSGAAHGTSGAAASILSPTVLFALPPILLWGLSGFLQKVATNHLTGERASFAYLGAFVPVALYFVAREPWPSAMTPKTWTLVLAVGFFLAFGNLALLLAFARGGQAAVIAPLSSLYPLISIPVAVGVLGEKLGVREMVGIGFALASVAAFSIEWPAKRREAST